jgi:hypothetical protein
MKRRSLALLALVALLVLGLAPAGFDTLSVPSTAAVPLPRAGISGRAVQTAYVTNIGTTLIYFRIDGGVPAVGAGDTIWPGGGEKLENPLEVSNFQAISASGTGLLAIHSFE